MRNKEQAVKRAKKVGAKEQKRRKKVAGKKRADAQAQASFKKMGVRVSRSMASRLIGKINIKERRRRQLRRSERN